MDKDDISEKVEMCINDCEGLMEDLHEILEILEE